MGDESKGRLTRTYAQHFKKVIKRSYGERIFSVIAIPASLCDMVASYLVPGRYWMAKDIFGYGRENMLMLRHRIGPDHRDVLLLDAGRPFAAHRFDLDVLDDFEALQPADVLRLSAIYSYPHAHAYAHAFHAVLANAMLMQAKTYVARKFLEYKSLPAETLLQHVITHEHLTKHDPRCGCPDRFCVVGHLYPPNYRLDMYGRMSRPDYCTDITCYSLLPCAAHN